MSDAYYGSCHDYRMLKEEFNPKQGTWFDEHDLYVDLGFLGIDKDYHPQIPLPFKRKKQQELNFYQQQFNKSLSQIRIKVEHAIGGIKRFRILADRLRIKCFYKYNQIAKVCAGIWNFCLTN